MRAEELGLLLLTPSEVQEHRGQYKVLYEKQTKVQNVLALLKAHPDFADAHQNCIWACLADKYRHQTADQWRVPFVRYDPEKGWYRYEEDMDFGVSTSLQNENCRVILKLPDEYI